MTEQSDHGDQTVVDDEAINGEVLLPTVVPGSGRTDGEPYSFSPSLILLSNPASLQAESIGALRNHLIAQHVRDGRRSLVMCGPSMGVGCSFLTANTGLAMAQAGINTLIIDANLRDPAMDDYFCPSEPAPGLAQFLTDPTSGGDGMLRINVLPNLSLMHSGGKAENAQELLASTQFKSLMDECVRNFDLVLVDSPAANSAGDACRIASVLNYALIVTRCHSSYVSDVQTLANDLHINRAKVVGTFLNDF